MSKCLPIKELNQLRNIKKTGVLFNQVFLFCFFNIYYGTTNNTRSKKMGIQSFNWEEWQNFNCYWWFSYENLTASTAASAGPLIVTRVDSMRRRYPCSGAIRWGWYPSASVISFLIFSIESCLSNCNLFNAAGSWLSKTL